MGKSANSRNQNLNATEAARLLTIPLSTFYHLSKKGSIKGIRIGGRWRYKLEDIERYRKYGCTEGLVSANNEKQAIAGKETFSSYDSQTLPHVLKSVSNCNCKSSEDEKRAHSRINANLPSKVFHPLKDYKQDVTIRNISEGGLCFQAASLNGRSVGDPIVLDFMLDGPTKTTLTVNGRIVYVYSNRVGIKFRYLGDKQKEEIRRYVG